MMKSLKTLKPCFQQNKQSQLLTKLINHSDITDSVHLSCELGFDQARFVLGSMCRQHICKAYIHICRKQECFVSFHPSCGVFWKAPQGLLGSPVMRSFCCLTASPNPTNTHHVLWQPHTMCTTLCKLKCDRGLQPSLCYASRIQPQISKCIASSVSTLLAESQDSPLAL